MQERLYNNADSFVMAFDAEWEKINCNDENLKILKIIENLSNHPFVRDNPNKVKDIANFRVKSLKKFK